MSRPTSSRSARAPRARPAFPWGRRAGDRGAPWTHQRGMCLNQNMAAGLQATIPAYALAFAKYMASQGLNHLILHVTNACNFRCEHCFIDFSPKKDLTFEEIARLAAAV